MSKKFIESVASEFIPNGDLDTCDLLPGWISFLLKRLAENKIRLEIRDVHGWPHISPRKPFQLEIPTPDDEEYISYVLKFFGTERIARAWSQKHGLTIADGLPKIPT